MWRGERGLEISGRQVRPAEPRKADASAGGISSRSTGGFNYRRRETPADEANVEWKVACGFSPLAYTVTSLLPAICRPPPIH